MKRFDFDSIRQRLLARLRISNKWAQFLDNGVIANLIDVYAEGEAELARYLEYLLMEKKWLTAQNMSSLTHMARLISRKPRRPVSAAGFVIVSHTDETGVDRLSNLGRSFFDIDAESNYDNITLDSTVVGTATQALVPWTYSAVYTVPRGSIFTASNGTQFISTEAVQSRYLNVAFNTIKSDSDLYNNFLKAGGWNGIKYLKIPVIQGIQRKKILGIANGSRFETFSIEASNVEDANSSMSEDFFYIEVKDNGTGETEKWIEISNIRLAGPYDKVFETNVINDGGTLQIKFGDGVSGKLLTAGNTITIHYLETKGASGNIDAKYQIVDIAFPDNYVMTDPRQGNIVSKFLSCTNTYPLLGGRDAEDFENFRLEAPTSYLKSYATATKKEYEEKILKYSPINLGKLKVFADTSYTVNNLSTNISDLYCEVANEYTTIQNTLYITAIQANGEKIENAEDTFINPILKSMKNIKGPNDTLAYKEPNFIKFNVGARITTSSLEYSDSEISEYVKSAILNKYSILNTDFKSSFYNSVITATAKNFPFSDTAAIELEALADIDYNGTSLIEIDDTAGTELSNLLIAIPFKFDKIFASNAYLRGFKNYTTNSGFLIKANVNFIMSSSATKDRTFFLYDDRLDSAKMPTIEEAKELVADSDIPLPPLVNTINTGLGYDIKVYDETNEYYKNRQVRVAQFAYIDNITDDTFMIKAKDFAQFPYENRPYAVDNTGANAMFASDQVSADLKVAISDSSSSTLCYKINPDYIENVNIIFSENYDSPDSSDYAKGYLILPVSYFNITANMVDLSQGYTELARDITMLIQDQANIKIYARPKMNDFVPENEHDLIFIDDQDLTVETVHI